MSAPLRPPFSLVRYIIRFTHFFSTPASQNSQIIHHPANHTQCDTESPSGLLLKSVLSPAGKTDSRVFVSAAALRSTAQPLIGDFAISFPRSRWHTSSSVSTTQDGELRNVKYAAERANLWPSGHGLTLLSLRNRIRSAFRLHKARIWVNNGQPPWPTPPAIRGITHRCLSRGKMSRTKRPTTRHGVLVNPMCLVLPRESSRLTDTTCRPRANLLAVRILPSENLTEPPLYHVRPP